MLAAIPLLGALEDLGRFVANLDSQLSRRGQNECDGRRGMIRERLLCLDWVPQGVSYWRALEKAF